MVILRYFARKLRWYLPVSYSCFSVLHNCYKSQYMRRDRLPQSFVILKWGNTFLF